MKKIEKKSYHYKSFLKRRLIKKIGLHTSRISDLFEVRRLSLPIKKNSSQNENKTPCH